MIYAKINYENIYKLDFFGLESSQEIKKELRSFANETRKKRFVIEWDNINIPVDIAVEFLAKEGFIPVSETFFYKQ